METVSKYTAQKKLAITWFIMGGAIFLFLAIQTMIGKYDSKETAVWSWFLPLMLPVFGLITGVFIAAEKNQNYVSGNVSKFYFNLTVAFSVCYLLLIFMTVLASNFLSGFEEKTLSRSGIWLAPIQGIVMATLGVFYTKADKEAKGNPLGTDPGSQN